ncbi:MAG: response regulator transcription factor [Chloroflexales bacterium]|nr:response regulator transcription factor [Chloroflexales bacterium]
MITIVLVDDHPIVRQGLRALLAAEPGYAVVGEAADGLTAVHMVSQLQPAVLVADLMMPGLGGLEVTRQVRALPNPPQVIVLSMHADEVYVLDALRSGAAAYVLKENDTAQLIAAVRAVVAGQRYLSPPLSERAIDSYTRQTHATPIDPVDLLTAREREVLRLVAQGRTNATIATALTISARTVETHRANLMRKLGLHTQAELARLAVQCGLVGPAPAHPDH